MSLSLLLLLLLVTPISAVYLNAVDIKYPTTPDKLMCLQSSHVDVIYVRGYKVVGLNSTLDLDGVQTIKNALRYNTFSGINVYIEPNGNSNMNGAQQLDDLYLGLVNNGINIRSVWIQMIDDNPWNRDQNINIAFINSFISRANQYGLTVGIYTSAADWQAVTGNDKTINSKSLLLWYYNIFWYGATGETNPDFSDFTPFGPFSLDNVVVKQYGKEVSMCNESVGMNVQLQ